MVDTPDSISLARLQGTGGNNNLWGGYLNTVITLLSRLMKGYQAYTVNGDATVSWTNYSATNDFAVGNVKLIPGTVAAAFTLTLPNYHQSIRVKNTTLYAGTIKCSGGTGVTIPSLATMQIYCDGTDFSNIAPSIFSTGITVAGIISGLTAGVAATDAVNKTQMETAIATAGLPATSGTILNSANDTTAGYLGQKISVAGDLALSTQNPGANEARLVTHTPYWATPTVVTTGTTACADRGFYLCRTGTGAITLTAPATGRFKFVDVDGSAATNNITVAIPTGETIMDGAASENFIADMAWFSAEVTRRTGGTNWSVG